MRGTTEHLPVAAVVLPVHADPGIAHTLRSLRRLDWPADRLHVLVALDGPDPETERVARQHGAHVVVLPTNQGSYAARNAAVDALPDDVEIVAFTDADCEVMPRLLHEHAAALRVADLSGGAVEVTLRRRASPAEWVDSRRHLRQKQYVEVDGYAATANLAVRRSVLGQVRFTSGLRSGGDADFCLRARAAGLSLVYTEGARVLHPARTTDAEVMKKVRRICTGIEANPARWKDRVIRKPSLRASLRVVRQAHRAKTSRGPLWDLRAFLLDQRASRAVFRSAARAKSRT
ncbi:MAG: glycosyltransferase family A protein [Mycobacteriales bacterium]|nr:glycosyltransferase family A protein [Mycobacteriales bacterium]